ncbi:MAG: hypothetical protein BWY89_01753 [Bacteroidetes bacterium ADurb.BinA012]|nr:MAG: hypothetical protein BWY89_01753 [Bacteroidetes bacterium ADurb.BinA012]
MLHLQAKLSQHRSRHIHRVLGDEVNSHALGTYKFDYCFDLFKKNLACLTENEVCLINENHQFRLWNVTLLRHGIVNLGKQRKHECGEKLRLVLDVCQPDDVNVSVPAGVSPHQV